MNEYFRKFAEKISDITGSSWTFVVFLLVLVVWFAAGYALHFPERWQTIFDNTSSILFLLLLLLMQSTQNRDSRVLHLKLDELLRAVEGARKGMVQLENLSDEDLEKLAVEFERLQREHIKSDGISSSDESASAADEAQTPQSN